jgi:hypothetical protein
MVVEPVAPDMENAQARRKPENILAKMMNRKRTVQQYIREGRVNELGAKGIKVVQPF